MLVIRKEQMDVMGDYMFDNFVSNMVAHLREAYPEETKSDDDRSLGAFVRENVGRANAFDIRAAENLEFFLDCVVVYGPEFYHSPDYAWAQTILADDLIDETEKMNRINEYQIFVDG